MHSYTPRRKEQAAQSTQDAAPRTSVAAGRIPNSAMLTLNGISDSGGYVGPDLEQRMRSRLSGVRERPQAQIPQAEKEADRLSAAVHAGTPESVKTMMGQRMGADFSGVRFHTGAAAAAKADALGARAYTSGTDVYFGTAGFDPTVAAHELVHTVQQGMVSSGVSTMATPVGGVQMWPWKKKNNDSGQTAAPTPASAPAPAVPTGATDAAAAPKKDSFIRNIWNKTGGRAIRKHHDAMNEFHEAQQAQQGGKSDWDELSQGQRALWAMKNPLAYAQYKLSQSTRNDTARRIGDRQIDLANAKAFLDPDRKRISTEGTSMLRRGANGGFEVGLGTADAAGAPEGIGTFGDAVDQASNAADTADNVSVPAETASAFQEANWLPGFGENVLSGGLGGLKMITGAVGAGKAIKDLKENWGESSGVERPDMVPDAASGAGQAAGGSGPIAKAAGPPGASVVVGSAGMATGAIDMYKGSRMIHQGRMQANAMDAFQEKHYANAERGNLEKEDLVLMDSAAQGRAEAGRMKLVGTGHLLTGAMDIAAGAAEAGGVTSAAGAAISGVSAATKGGFAIADHIRRKNAEREMTAKTTGLTEDKIREFQKMYHIKSFSRAKQALMKAMGYESGQRAELYADQTELRGEYLAQKANAASTANANAAGSAVAGDAKAEELVGGLGVKKKGVGGYRAEDVTERLGHWKSRADIASGFNAIRKKAALNRQRNQQRNQQAAMATP